jgi:predicted DNA-binding protein YlxM (UPF0122 family)
MKNNWNFKNTFKPSVCSMPPWQFLIPANQRLEILRIIRNECQDAYGQSLDECTKRLVCFKKTCLGRELPWKSKTARPYLEQLKLTHNMVLNPDTNELELVIDTSCSNCPIVKKCDSLCNQMVDFIARDKTIEPVLEYQDDMSNLNNIYTDFSPSNFLMTIENIPWDVLSPKKQEIVNKCVLEERDFRSVGKFLLGKENSQASIKLQLYSAMNKLSLYANVREFLKLNKDILTDRQYQVLWLVYMENNTMVEVAKEMKVSKQNIQQIISKVLKKHNIKGLKYVKTKNNQPQYINTSRFK